MNYNITQYLSATGSGKVRSQLGLELMTSGIP